MERDAGARQLAELLMLGSGSPAPVAPTRRGPARQVEQLLDTMRDAHHVAVVLHDHPDPDAIGSGLALSRLLQARLQPRVSLVYGGVIARAENRALVNELRIELTPAADFDWADVDATALVDCQPASGNHCLPEGRVPTVVLDHHPRCSDIDAATFADIRPEYGATCTILTEYLEDAQVHVDERLATALFYGIKTDTQDLGRQASGIDALAYLRLFVAADKRALARIQNPRLPRRYFRAMHDAFERVNVHGDTAVARLGTLAMPETNGETADLIVRLEGVRWALSVGRFRDRLLFSVRTTDASADAGRVAEQLADGRGHAGGHWRLAGGSLTTEGLASEEVDALEGRLIEHFLKLAGAPTDETPLLGGEEGGR